MSWKKISCILLILFIFGVGYSEVYEYVIVKNTNTVVYKKPDVKSGKVEIRVYEGSSDKEGFFGDDLLRVYEITNIKGVEWGLVFKKVGKWKGWIKLDKNVYRFKDDGENGKLFWEFVKKEIFGYYGRFESEWIINVSFTNFNNGYVMIHYTDFDEYVFTPTSVYYKLENGEWKRVMKDNGLYREYIFYKNYIILVDDSSHWTKVYDTQKIWEPFPGIKLYRRISDFSPSYRDNFKSPQNYNDSYSSFDTNTGILTVHLRFEKGKPFVLKYYQFDETNGKFIPLEQTNDSVVTDKYYILTGDNVNVRAEATTNSKVLLQLKKGTRVKVLKRSDVGFMVDGKKGYWVYIDTGVKDKKGKTIKGWVVDVYLKQEE